jgi:uncharacterized protein (TIGR02147 family)
MANVFDYTDFRKFLQDRYAELKADNPSFTYRHIANHVGFSSPGFLTQICQAKSNLPERMIPDLSKVLGLRRIESRYFALMVCFNQARSHNEKKKYFERMLVFKKGRVKTVDPDEYLFYDKWYYSAIRALLSYYHFDGDFKKLSKLIQPSITPLEAQKAISVLVKLGFVAKNSDNAYTLTQKHITTGLDTDAVVINNFVINTLEIAKDAFYRFQKEQRSFSSLTLSISKAGYSAIKNRTDQFRKELVEIVENDTGIDRVYQVNIQLFPLSVIETEEVQ